MSHILRIACRTQFKIQILKIVCRTRLLLSCHKKHGIQIYGTLSDRSIGRQTCCDQCDQRPISQREHLLTSNHDPVNSLNIKSRHIKVHSTMIARHTQFYNA